MISFKQLENFLDNADISIMLKKTSTGIAVSVMPKPKVDDSSKENLIPLLITGTAEELDQEFLQLINPQLEEATGIINNIAEFEANAKEMKAKSAAEKEAKDAKKKLNEASKKALEGADKLLEEGKFDECQAAIDKATKDNPDYRAAKTLQKKLDKAKPADNQSTMFDDNAEQPKAEEKSEPVTAAPTTPNTLQQTDTEGNKIGEPIQLGNDEQSAEEFVEENAGNLTSEQAGSVLDNADKTEAIEAFEAEKSVTSQSSPEVEQKEDFWNNEEESNNSDNDDIFLT